MKIISWNVASLPALQGFIEHEKGSMSRFLEDAGVDIMCFQGRLVCVRLAYASIPVHHAAAPPYLSTHTHTQRRSSTLLK